LHFGLRLLGILKSLCLKGFNSLELLRDVVGDRLVRVESLFNLVNNSLILELRAVRRKVDLGRLVAQLINLFAGILEALLKRIEGSGGSSGEVQGADDPAPLDPGNSLLLSVTSHSQKAL
jgi:hypothetical protein